MSLIWTAILIGLLCLVIIVLVGAACVVGDDYAQQQSRRPRTVTGRLA